MDFSSDAVDLGRLVIYLQNLEKRISRLEAQMQIDSSIDEEGLKLPFGISQKISNQTDSLENTIGQYWFAKVGIVFLLIGIVFLLTFPYKNLPPYIPGLTGIIFSGIMIFISRYSNKSLPFLSNYIFGGGLVLFYFSVLRFHFFSSTHLIESTTAESFLLIIASTIYLFTAYNRKSVYLNFIGITLAAVTFLLTNNAYSITASLILLSFYLVHLKIKFSWAGLFGYGISIVYITNIIWFLNNPIIGTEISVQARPIINLFSFLIFILIFSFGNIYRPKGENENSKVISGSFINCFWGYGLILIFGLVEFKSSLTIVNFIASILFLSIAVLFWMKEESKYSTFIYSIAGYTALSVAIISQFAKPDFFVWLSWQSILVVSTAIWFRSKIIIVANFVMYLLIFFSYLALAGSFGVISLSFGFVALLSARILNWKKDRLDLKTDMMRIAYLAAAFFIFPYALYHIIPKNFISLSWTVVALIYYFLSVILKNKKYRWMALLTFLLTVLHILFVDITNLEPSFRIISFIAVGAVLIAISIYYTRLKSKAAVLTEENSQRNESNAENNHITNFSN